MSPFCHLFQQLESHLTHAAFPAQQAQDNCNVGLSLVQRRRRWTNVNPTLILRLESAGWCDTLVYDRELFLGFRTNSVFIEKIVRT